MSKTLYDIKVGESVLMPSVFSRHSDRLEIVERVTPTQIIVCGRRYRKEDGACIGIRLHNGVVPPISVPPQNDEGE